MTPRVLLERLSSPAKVGRVLRSLAVDTCAKLCEDLNAGLVDSRLKAAEVLAAEEKIPARTKLEELERQTKGVEFKATEVSGSFTVAASGSEAAKRVVASLEFGSATQGLPTVPFFRPTLDELYRGHMGHMKEICKRLAQ